MKTFIIEMILERFDNTNLYINHFYKRMKNSIDIR